MVFTESWDLDVYDTKNKHKYYSFMGIFEKPDIEYYYYDDELNIKIPIYEGTFSEKESKLHKFAEDVINNKILRISPEEEKVLTIPPYGWACLQKRPKTGLDILFSQDYSEGDTKYSLVFLGHGKTVEGVFVLIDGWENYGAQIRHDNVHLFHPERIDILVIHEADDPKQSYASARMTTTVMDHTRQNERDYVMWEMLLNDDSAQKVIDLISGDTPFICNALISIEFRKDEYMMKKQSLWKYKDDYYDCKGF